MPDLDSATFERLVSAGPRLPWLQRWLLEEVWSPARYRTLSRAEYLEKGERAVNALEEVVAAAAPRVYEEMLAPPDANRDIRHFLSSEALCAAVVFDGLSLRELPALLELAERSRLGVREVGVGLAALPSETVDYVEQRLGAGHVTPTQLPSRRELRDAGIDAYYYDNANERHQLDGASQALLLWSSFPDYTYRDSGARFREHFEQIHVVLETAWLNTVQQIPRGRTILVTSDHGYVYFGAGLSFPRSNAQLRPLTQYLGGERFKRLSESETCPVDSPDLAVYPDRKVAVLRGRVQTHPPGPSASKLYKHGGLSIMEMLTPWVVFQVTG
jgi:hypothetical protein